MKRRPEKIAAKVQATVDLPGMGSDENEPCEDRPRNGFATCNNRNDFERIGQFRREALSSEIASPSALARSCPPVKQFHCGGVSCPDESQSLFIAKLRWLRNRDQENL